MAGGRRKGELLLRGQGRGQSRSALSPTGGPCSTLLSDKGADYISEETEEEKEVVHAQ
jgi:hypothetical protein